MRVYKALFVDDRPEQHEVFKEITLNILRDKDISFDPIDYAFASLPLEAPEPKSAKTFLTEAEAQSAPYDIVITDLNFKEPYGIGGPRDGFAVLRAAKQFCPQAKLILITAYGRDVGPQEAIQIAEETGLSSAAWFNLSGGAADMTWRMLAEFCEGKCNEIDLQRALAATNSVPDLYEVVVIEDEGDDRLTKRLRVKIAEKKTVGIVSPELVLTGDHALIFEALMWAEGSRVSGKALMRALNKKRGADPIFDIYSPTEVQVLLDKFAIKLLGEKEENKTRRMCRHDNAEKCAWQDKGIIPIGDTEEGYTCLKETRVRGSNGYCPKLGHKRQAPGIAKGLDDEGGSERRKVSELRQMLKPFDTIFGSDFSTEKGLIRTFKGRGGGYALAGTLSHRD